MQTKLGVNNVKTLEKYSSTNRYIFKNLFLHENRKFKSKWIDIGVKNSFNILASMQLSLTKFNLPGTCSRKSLHQAEG